MRDTSGAVLPGVTVEALADLVNTSDVLNVNRRYGASWLNVFQTIGGRMIELSAQFDF